ncbi:MAG: hypothetical protein WCO05_04210 [Candidatus Moraniibacteriota bacterium]|jgi:hypothetical protein
MKNKINFVVVVCLFFVVTLIFLNDVYAATTLTYPTTSGLPENANGVRGIFTNVADLLLRVIGIIAIIGFVISGFQYFLVATDEKMLQTAKKSMVASAIGIAVALSGVIAIKAVEMLLTG